MTTVRLDEHVTCRCDCCAELGPLVEHRPGWRWGLDGWLFYGVGDVQLCPRCARRVEDVKRREAA